MIDGGSQIRHLGKMICEACRYAADNNDSIMHNDCASVIDKTHCDCQHKEVKNGQGSTQRQSEEGTCSS